MDKLEIGWRNFWFRGIARQVQEGQNEELMLTDLIRIRRCTDDFITRYMETQGELPDYGADTEAMCVVPLEEYGYKLPGLDDFIDLHVRIFEDRIEAKRKESLA
jgi:hypothetical protein